MDAEFRNFDASDYFQQFDWFVTFESLELFIRNQGSHAKGHFDAFDDSAQRNVLTLIGMFAVSIVQSIIDIQVERNSRNEPTESCRSISFVFNLSCSFVTSYSRAMCT
jgi:hypothetical protein